MRESWLGIIAIYLEVVKKNTPFWKRGRTENWMLILVLCQAMVWFRVTGAF